MRISSLAALCLSLPLTLVACGDKEEGADSDGDGVADADDCAPDDAAVYPGATEVCDEVDNDCNGEIDEGVGTIFYADADGDGHGGEGLSIEACAAPEGYLEAATDCDDLDASVNPDAAEVCDGVDNDCDELVDGDDSSADLTTGGTYYADADGDGFGVEDSTTEACGAPDGYAEVAGDCDDGNADVNPDTVWYADVDQDGFGAELYTTTGCEQPEGYVADASDCADLDPAINPDATEVCDGGVDNDCNGDADDADAGVDTSTFSTWYGDTDGDGYGADDASSMSCAAPSGAVADGGDCDDDAGDVNPGVAEVCNDGIDNDCSGDAPECGLATGALTIADADATVTGVDTYDYFGRSLAVLDMDGDGEDELAVGAWGDDASASAAGEVSIFDGVTASGTSDDLATLQLRGEGTSDYLGYAVADGGDVDGDGYDDLIVGAYRANSYAGAAYIVYGAASGSGAYDIEDVATSFSGTSGGSYSGDYLGHSVTGLGDIDGDGYDDIGLGAYGDDDAGSSSGSLFIVYGSASGSAGGAIADASDAQIVGPRSSANFAYYTSVEGKADFDGDGYGDFVAGAYYSANNYYGGAYFLYGDGGRMSGTMSVDDADANFSGSGTSDYFGRTVEVGDVTGDGYDDALVWEYYGASDAGRVYVLAGGATQYAGEYAAATEAALTLSGTSSYDYFGRAMAVGDFNSDGNADLLVGAGGVDTGGSTAGAMYAYMGPLSASRTASDADFSVLGDASSQYLGYYGVDAGDMDGDGADDVIGGAYGDMSSTGSVVVFLGGGM